MVCGSSSRGSKSRLAKAAGAEPSGQMRDENCTPLWRAPCQKGAKREGFVAVSKTMAGAGHLKRI